MKKKSEASCNMCFRLSICGNVQTNKKSFNKFLIRSKQNRLSSYENSRSSKIHNYEKDSKTMAVSVAKESIDAHCNRQWRDFTIEVNPIKTIRKIVKELLKKYIAIRSDRENMKVFISWRNDQTSELVPLNLWNTKNSFVQIISSTYWIYVQNCLIITEPPAN